MWNQTQEKGSKYVSKNTCQTCLHSLKYVSLYSHHILINFFFNRKPVWETGWAALLSSFLFVVGFVLIRNALILSTWPIIEAQQVFK